MFIKKIKRICSVRGCKNTQNVFIISRRREVGGSVAICTDCMRDAIKDTESYKEPEKAKTTIRPLFPHLELKQDVTTSNVDDFTEEVEPNEPTKSKQDDVSNTLTSAEDVVTSAEAKEDTATADFFSEMEKEPTKPTVPPKSNTTAKKTNKSSKKKK